ncbi:E3 ubiquitin-protein ligase Topors [Pimephales promelas]|uniref:E3 ubiquitin-protein ligase Topors n=1 Tax=Pimephales promelas TaxID=90988 RepID=UPI0019556A51|nr:E3 ubiquitin-protein ligase Topors [Pimephales promelas]KAG1926391.1 E3 ubiquitin-protein ligase Topors [Pimephales promelas]
MMAPTKMKLRVRKKDSVGKSSQRLLANASPDSKCPICLDGFNNVASLDRCLHQFCFRCIHEWSKNKAECPLCKQPFHSIYHSVKGEKDFKEFVVPPMENGAAANATASNAPQRVLRPRALRGRERRSHRAQQPVPSSSPPMEDVMFGGLTDAAALTENQDVQQMVLRLTARRQGRGEGRSLRRLRDQDVVSFRRALYRTGVRVRNTRDVGRQRDISASFLRQNPGCLRRLLPWLQRELTVLYGSHGSLVNIVQNIIISRIMNYNMEDSAIRDELRPFLLARTDHFLHELVSFARSTLNMETYDQQAIYDCPAPSYEEGSSSDLSVIAISEDDDDDDNDSEDNVTENPSAVQEHLASVANASGVESLLSQSAWDDETPGPSYSTLFPSSSQSQDEEAEPSSSTAPPYSGPDCPAASSSVSAGRGEDNEEEECLIVGYVKPMAERTPELVQLSSDSSEEEQEAADTKTPTTVTKSETSQMELPSQSHMNLRVPSLSPGLAPSCSPQRTHSESLSRERKTDYLSCRAHPSNDGSDLRQNRDDTELIAHERRKDSHQRSINKEKAKRSEKSWHDKTPDCSPIQTRSPPSWSGQSPTVSVWSGSPVSGSNGSDCSTSLNNTSLEHSCHVREKLSQSPSYSRKRKIKENKSRSPDLNSFLNSHHPRESHRCRKRRKRAISSSSADSQSERSCLDKPSGKRKYKTRHLERAAQRLHEDGTATKEKRRRRSRERSPSVEIIYERRAPEPHWHQRKKKKKKHRKRKRELRSPTVITIDSDSDRTIDCLDRVMDIIDQTAADVEPRDGTPGQDMIQNLSCTLASSNPQSESSSPVADPTTERTLNLDDYVVDVVDRSSSDCSRNLDESSHEEFVPNPFPMASMSPAPPSDTRLLETILQDLEEFLPEARTSPYASSHVQQERASIPRKDQSDTRGVTENLEKKNTDGDGPQEAVTDIAS